MSFPYCEMTYEPLEQVICYEGYGGCVSSGGGRQTIETTEDIRGAGGSCVLNDKIYIALSLRQVKYRANEVEWVSVGNDISVTIEESEQANYGFSDVDGFDENHIYAVGGDGDVWRCIDNKWIQCGFPTNLSLDVVCCAGDDNVYISGTSGIT